MTKDEKEKTKTLNPEFAQKHWWKEHGTCARELFFVHLNASAVYPRSHGGIKNHGKH
jgi:hypothetical protein